MQRRATSLKMIKLSEARPQGQERGLSSAYLRRTPQLAGQLAKATAIRRSPGREIARDAGHGGPRFVLGQQTGFICGLRLVWLRLQLGVL